MQIDCVVEAVYFGRTKRLVYVGGINKCTLYSLSPGLVRMRPVECLAGVLGMLRLSSRRPCCLRRREPKGRHLRRLVPGLAIASMVACQLVSPPQSSMWRCSSASETLCRSHLEHGGSTSGAAGVVPTTGVSGGKRRW